MRRLFGAVLFGTLMALGCSAEARSRVKHFFFEVPAEGESPEAAPAVLAARPEAPGTPTLTLPPPRYASLHPPFVERQCRECHNAEQRMAVRDDMLASCKTCHEPYFDEDLFHFPVAEGECATCHDMHRSAHDNLLIMPVKELCVMCHDPPVDLSQPAHAVEGVDNCSACHDPHFGDPPMLKENPSLPIRRESPEDEE